MALEKELETYKNELPKLLADAKAGNFVLIVGDKVIGVFKAYEDAVQEGYKVAKLAPFLVRKIETAEKVHFFTRPITPVAALPTTD